MLACREAFEGLVDIGSVLTEFGDPEREVRETEGCCAVDGHGVDIGLIWGVVQ